MSASGLGSSPQRFCQGISECPPTTLARIDLERATTMQVWRDHGSYDATALVRAARRARARRTSRQAPRPQGHPRMRRIASTSCVCAGRSRSGWPTRTSPAPTPPTRARLFESAGTTSEDVDAYLKASRLTDATEPVVNEVAQRRSQYAVV